jgi:TRAP-type C4-dicarboxylate transport system substrate-binding protein
MRMNRRTVMAGMISLAAPALIGRRALGQEMINLTISSSHPEFIPWVTPLKTVLVEKSNALLEQRGSAYRINWTEAFGGTLYDFNDTLEAVSQQLTDMGWIGSIWEPATLPLQNIMYSAPFTTQTVTQAINTMNRLNDTEPAMKKEWTGQNVTFFGSCVSDGYHLFTKKPIEKLADLEGVKLLGVPVCAPWVEPLGATLVNTGIPAMYGQLQTGVGDGTILIGTGAYPLKLHEQAPFVTRVNTGPLTFGGFGVNTDSYNALPEDVQQVIAELGRDYSVENARLIEER